MEESRKLRIKRLKRLILIIVLLLLLLPTIFCIILFGRITALEKQLSDIVENREMEALVDNRIYEIEEVVIQAEEQQSLEKFFYFEEDFEQLEQPNLLIDDTRNKVYLTFDDGPSQYTDEILDILKNYGVKATFFVVGKTEEKYEAMYQRIVKEGHSLGLHSFSHDYREIYESVEAYAMDLYKLQDFLEEMTGVRSDIVRFPGGSSNQVSKLNMREFISYLEDIDMEYYDWNIASGEIQAQNIGVEQIINNCTNTIDTLGNSIILMHDIGNNPAIVKALPIIIEKILEEENNILLPITEATIPIQHTINE